MLARTSTNSLIRFSWNRVIAVRCVRRTAGMCPGVCRMSNFICFSDSFIRGCPQGAAVRRRTTMRSHLSQARRATAATLSAICTSICSAQTMYHIDASRADADTDLSGLGIPLSNFGDCG